MSALDINSRLKSLFEANRGVSQLISRLSKLSSTPDSQTDENQVRVELSAEIHQTFKELEEDFELVKQEAEDYTTTGSWSSGARRNNSERDKDRVAIATQVERLGEDLKLARAQFRKAQLQAKRSAEAAKLKEREQLFAGVQEGNESRVARRRGQEKLSQDDLLLNASNDVTAALRRTHQLMQSELNRSQFAHETLQRSTAALQSLNESYSTLDTLLSSSKSLVSTLLSSQKSDTWYLETAFWILVYTITWLVFRRIFYGPIRYLFYLPTKWMLNIFLSFVNLLAGIAAGSGEEVPSEGLGSRSSLIVQPSASGRGAHRFDPNMPKPSIPAGAGGQGAKEGKGGESLADKVGQMAEETQKEEQQGGAAVEKDEDAGEPGIEEEGDEEDEDGDEDEGEEQKGTVLRPPTEEETPNPKKRMWEEPSEGGEGHDEL